MLSKTVTIKMYDLIVIQILLHLIYHIANRMGWVTRITDCLSSLL
jgi:hypothetical protein